MNTNKYILWCSACIVVFIGVISILLIYDIETQVTSSPVEEMYHRQLVVTLDSILDARFDDGCCEEDIDTVNANTFHTHFSSILSPME